MQFNSFAFLLFFPLATAGYFTLPHRWRWCWLLAASIYFYSYFIPAYFLILASVIVVDYFAGLLIEKSGTWHRKCWLLMSISANVSVLAAFKYYNFIDANLAALATFIGWNFPITFLALALPVGLSFHTFQAMSYTIEVYRGRQKAERHFGIYALYVMFYPQLVAGPIERPQHLLHQFYEIHCFDYERIVSGLQLMTWGFFKKIVVADRLARVVNPVYATPARFDGPLLAIATIFFAFQIFCDFSGYSDIAIGSARVMGFRLMNNFDRPYHAQSLAEFWRRWHISLSTWFRDYLYIPLGGNRVPFYRWCINVLTVFLISGLWHGANWTYAIWGTIHGAFLVLGRATAILRGRVVAAIGLVRYPSLHSVLRVLCTFILVDGAWVFFRAPSIRDAWHILTHLGSRWDGNAAIAAFNNFESTFDISSKDILISLGALVAVESYHLLRLLRPATLRIGTWPWWLRWSAYYAIVTAIFVSSSTDNLQFIYFQF